MNTQSFCPINAQAVHNPELIEIESLIENNSQGRARTISDDFYKSKLSRPL